MYKTVKSEKNKKKSLWRGKYKIVMKLLALYKERDDEFE